MKVVRKRQREGGLVRLEVTASTAEVSDALAQATSVFCSQMNVRPVRGKTPAQAAFDQLGIRDLDSVVAKQAIDMLVPLALDKQSLTPAFLPEPQSRSGFERGHSFKFDLDVMPKPVFQLEDYSPVEITIAPFKSDESKVDQYINEMARNYVEFVADEPHPLRKGDSCLLKMTVSKDGQLVKSLTADSRPFTLGRGMMPPGFESGVEGMDVGETREFAFEGPGVDENKNEISEKFDATITLLEVQKERVPIIDDAWVKKNMPMYESLEAMKDSIRANINAEGLRRYEDYRRNVAASELAKRFKGSIPDDVYEGTMRESQTKLRQRVQAQGVTWEQFVEQQGGEQQLGMMLMVDTRQQLVRGYALDAYYRHEGLSFSEEDLDEVCFTMNPRDPKLVRKRMERSGLGYALRESAERLCACKRLVERAIIVEKDRE